jgi:Holliday junction resolvase
MEKDKLTENDVVLKLKKHLEDTGWEIGDNFCLGQKQGRDIEAKRNGQILVIEVKGQNQEPICL